MDSIKSKLFWFQFSLFILFAALLLTPMLSYAQFSGAPDWTYDRISNLCPPLDVTMNRDGTTTITVGISEEERHQIASVTLNTSNPRDTSMLLRWTSEETGQLQESSGTLGSSDYKTGRTITANPTITTNGSATQIDPGLQERFLVLINNLAGSNPFPYPIDAGFVTRDGGLHHFFEVRESQRHISCVQVEAGALVFGYTNITLIVQSAEALSEYIQYTASLENSHANLKAQNDALTTANASLTTQVSEYTIQNADLTTRLAAEITNSTNLSNQLTATAENEGQCITAYEAQRDKLNNEKAKNSTLQSERSRLLQASDEMANAIQVAKRNAKQLIRKGLSAGTEWLRGLKKFMKSTQKSVKKTLTGN